MLSNISVSFDILTRICIVLRLTPVYIVVYAIYAFLMDSFKPSPFFVMVDGSENCLTKWWRHLLYSQNLFEPEWVKHGNTISLR